MIYIETVVMVVMVLVNCIMLVAGQLLWKIGLKGASFGSFKDIVSLIFNKYIIGGIVIYAVATFYWLYVLKKYDLTKVYPLQSMSYILVMITGYFILRESISKNSLIGTGVIILGIFILMKK